MIKNGETYHYHVNGHGDVTALTDSAGNIVAQYQYDAWGNIISQTGKMAKENSIRYSGYRYDKEIGMYYLRARYYDSDIGRFLTRDSFQGFVNKPRSLNKYAYTLNNPVNRIDPTGYFSAFVNCIKNNTVGAFKGVYVAFFTGTVGYYLAEKQYRRAARLLSRAALRAGVRVSGLALAAELSWYGLKCGYLSWW